LIQQVLNPKRIALFKKVILPFKEYRRLKELFEDNLKSVLPAQIRTNVLSLQENLTSTKIKSWNYNKLFSFSSKNEELEKNLELARRNFSTF
jgi:type I restriction-modification system DNA methylase subunit